MSPDDVGAAARAAPVLRYYLLATSSVFLIVTAVTGILLFTELKMSWQSTVTRAVTLSELFQEHIERVFTNIAWLADAAGATYALYPDDPPALHHELRRLNEREKFSLQLSVVRKDGIFLASNLSEKSGVDLSDRPHIRGHLDADVGFIVSEPLKGRVSGELSLNISRRVYDGHGRWVGIAVVSADPSKLGRYLDREVGRDITASLFKTNGTLVARSQGLASAIGQNFAHAELFSHLQRDGTLIGKAETADAAARPRSLAETVVDLPSGVYVARSVIDGQLRVYSYRVVRNTPLIVVVGASFEAFQREADLAIVLSAVSLATLLAAMGLGAYFVRKYELQIGETQRAELAELQSRQTAQLLQASFRSSGVLVAVFNAVGRLYFTNEVTRRLTADSQGCAAALPWLFGELLEGGTPVRNGRRVLPVGGGESRSIFWTFSTAEWISPDANVAIGFDITELERRERSIEQKARLVSLGEMVTGLAHELAQPLTVITFSANMIREKFSTSDDDGPIAMLSRAADRVAKTVDSMKVFGRWQMTGKKVLFSVADCIASVELLTRNELRLHGIELVVHPLADDLVASADPVLLEPVLLNLVLNARDAVLDAPKLSRARIDVAAGRADGNQVYVRVHDNGPGVPERIRGRIFEPFFTTKQRGTGLGLALSFGIMTELGGTLALLPSEVGASFELRVAAGQVDDAGGGDQ